MLHHITNSPLLGFKEGIREGDFVSVLKKGIVHIVRVDVEKDWHVNLEKLGNYNLPPNVNPNSWYFY